MKADVLMTTVVPGMNFTELPMKGCEGFRLVHFVGGEVAATESCVRIENFDIFPDEVAELLREKSRTNVPTFIGSVGVDTPYLGQGIGPAMLKATLKRLSETYSTFVMSDVDDSVPFGWTKRQIPEMHKYMDELGWKSELIFQGTTDNKPTWVTQYSQK